jgi:hypothetical protein
MADEPIKRLRYFTGQFLEASDFATEQSYHTNLRRRGNRALYLAGILDDGFSVTYLSNERKIQISPGIGVDAQGRELVIVSPLTESPPAAGIHFVTLTYQEIETDLQSQTGADAVSEKTRFDETPKVRFFPDGTNIDKGTFIVIAKVTVDNAGAISGIDPSVRQFADGRFAGNLTVEGNVGIGTPSPSQRLQVTGGNGVINNVFLGNVGHGQDWAGFSHFTATSTAGYGFLHNSTGQFALVNKKSGGGYIGFRVDNADKMVISDAGNVGIGTTNPTSGKLQFDNSLGNKVVVWDGGPADRYGLGLNGGNLNAFVPAGSRFSVRQNGYDGTEVMSITGTGNLHAQGDTLSVSYRSNEGPRLLLQNLQKAGLGNEWAIYNMTGQYGDSLQFWNYGGNGWGSRLTIKDNGNVGIETMTPRAKLEVPGGAILNGVAIGVDPPPVSGVGDITFPAPYETIGTIDPRHNLRLHSNSWIVFHTGNVQGGTAFIDNVGNLTVNGSMTYGGQLNKLDVAEGDAFARIRAHDLLFGHSTRRGNMGRALVDGTNTLLLNYAGDWPNGCKYYVAMEKVSSKELKQDICSLSSSVAARIVRDLTPVTFKYKQSGCGREYLGFIAEDVPEEIAASDRKAINTDHIVTALTKVVQDQQHFLEVLEEKVRLLEQPS